MHVHLSVYRRARRPAQASRRRRVGPRSADARCNSYNRVGHSDLSGCTRVRHFIVQLHPSPARPSLHHAPPTPGARHATRPPDRDFRRAARDLDLAHGDARFRALVENVRDYAIVLLDPQGIVQSWNEGVEVIEGYREDEVDRQAVHDVLRRRGRAARLARVRVADGDARPAASRTKAGACAATARASGRASRSRRLFDEHAAGTPGFAKITRDLTDAPRAGAAAARERGALPPARQRRQGLRDLHARPRTARSRAGTPGAQAIKGYTANEILGRHFSIFYPPEVIARHWPEHELQVARETGRFEDEAWRMRKDGTRFWANVVITALRDSQGRAARIREGHARPDDDEARRGAAGQRAADERVPRDARPRAAQPALAAAVGARHPGAQAQRRARDRMDAQGVRPPGAPARAPRRRPPRHRPHHAAARCSSSSSRSISASSCRRRSKACARSSTHARRC